MIGFAALYVLALAVATTQATLPRMTHAEGLVTAQASGVRTGGGRAEIVLPDGALVHLDAGTTVRYSVSSSLALDDGRVLVRAGAAPVLLDTPMAGLRLEPGSICTTVVGRTAGRLLVIVAAGEVTLRTRYASTTRVIAGQSAILTSQTAVPWATTYVPFQLDGFALWSDARAAAGGWMTADAFAASGLSGAYVAPTAPCTSWPVWGAPCWVLPPPSAHPLPGPSGPPPSYAPSYTPNYAPNFNVAPPGPPPAGHGPTSPPAPPVAAPPPASQPPPPPPPPSAPPLKGRSGAVPRPERPPPS